jgi:hypothetical protein
MGVHTVPKILDYARMTKYVEATYNSTAGKKLYEKLEPL